MLKLNNKGFAITGILYTLFILFLLILVFILAGLSSKRTLLMQSLSTFEDKYAGKEKITCDTAKIPETCEQVIDTKTLKSVENNITLLEGKYIFVSNDNSITCSTYLKKGVDISSPNNLTYTTKDCNEYELNLTLKEVYNFEKE